MEKVKINLNDFSKIKNFISVVRGFSSDVDVITERSAFDGKSIMGLFSADLSGSVFVSIISDDAAECEKFAEEMKQFQ